MDAAKRAINVVALFGVKNHLRAAKKGEGLAGLPVRYNGIPNLSRSAQVHGLGGALNGAIPGRSEVVGLELNRRKAGGAFRVVGDTAISSRCIGEGDDGSGMQKAIGRHE